MDCDRRPDQKSGESFDWGPFDVPDSDFGDTQITNWAIEKLGDAHARTSGVMCIANWIAPSSAVPLGSTRLPV